MTTLKSDCRKFAPNIFNKTKCQNCFRTKDSHSAEALESNRATRKVAKCGYLFVAPDWDFTLSINRTKRWQRRWFILYDDGELTYSVDEHPNTVPQAVIDMNKVVDVADAEDITGNKFSVAISAPEKIHFIKGTSRDESKWWFDVLSRFPKSMVRGKHKRNATFPGGITTTSPVTVDVSKTNNGYTNSPIVRPRFHSFNTDNRAGIELQWQQLGRTEEDVFPTKDTPNTKNNMASRNSSNPSEEIENINNLIKSNIIHKVALSRQVLDNKQEHQNILDNVKDSISSKERLKIEDGNELSKNRSRRYLKRECRGIRSQRSRSDGVAKMIPPVSMKEVESEWLGQNSRLKNYHHNPVYLLLSDVPTLKRFESLESLQIGEGSPLPRRRHTSEKGESFEKNEHTEEILHSVVNVIKPEPISLDWNRNMSTPLRNGHHNPQETQTRLTPIHVIKSPKENHEPESKVQDETDTCDVDPVSPISVSSLEMRTDLTSEDLFIKKGWLLRLGSLKEWCKHWFVLKNTTLSYYRDPSAEDSGILDGILDLGLVKDVMEVETDRNYAFSITTWDNKKHVIGAVTVGIRCNWMQAICRAISLLDNNNKLPQSSPKEVRRHNSISSPALSSEEADRPVDVSSSDDHSEYYSVIDDEELMEERCSSPRALPPSPPVNRTAISRVKERARSRSNSRSRMNRRKLHSPVVSDGEYSMMNGENGHESDGCGSDNFPIVDTPRKDFLPSENGVLYEDVTDSKTPEVAVLEERCGELEERLKEQEKEIGVKAAELNNLKNLKGGYRELVERYNSLKKKLEEKQKSLAEDQEESHYKLKYESLRTKYRREKADRENRTKEHPDETEPYIEELIAALAKTKELLSRLKERIENFNGKKDLSAPMLKDVVKLCIEVENLITTGERKSKKDTELSKLKNCVSELQSSCNSKQTELDQRMKELGMIQECLERKKAECRQLQSELQKLKEENYVQMEKLKERHSASSPTSASDLESLVNSERLRFERALEEIRKLKRELKESQDNYDDIEICFFKLKQEMKDSENLHFSQMALMTARVDDLTSKLTTSERALRQLKQKTAKLEARQERRRSSLKGKEALSLSKEYEGKLVELEQKINIIESTLHTTSDENQKDDTESIGPPPQQVKRKASQDSTTSESNSMLLRLHSLDSRVKTATCTVDQIVSNGNSNNSLEKPKICLQVKSMEEVSSAEDAMENWSSLSVTTSMSDLHTIEPDDQEIIPSSLSEYVETLGQKIETMLRWLKSLLLILSRPESSENLSTESQLSSLGTLLDQLLTCRPDDSVCSGIETLVLKTMYDIILLQESAKSAFKLNDFSSYKAKSIQVGIDRLECTIQELEKRFSICGGNNWLHMEHLLKTLSKSEDIFQGSLLCRASLCMSSEQLLSKLNEQEQKFEVLSTLINQFQISRLQSIQHPSLNSGLDHAELPVKDSDQEAFAAKICGTIDDVHNDVLSMLVQREELQLSLLDYDHTVERNWNCAVRHYLQAGMSCLESEVKDALLRFYHAISKDKLEETYLLSVIRDLAHASAIQALLHGSIETLGQRLRETDIESQASSGWNKCLQRRLHRQASYMASAVLKCPSCVCEECSDYCSRTPVYLDAHMSELVEHYKRVLAEDRIHFNRDLEQLQSAVDNLHHEQECQRQEGCRTCRHLQQQVQRLHGELENCKVLAVTGSLCERCKELHRKLEILSEKHQKDLALAVEQEQESAKQKIQEILQQKEKIHAEDISKMKHEIHAAQRHFKHLQDQFDGQIQSLQSTYEQKLAQKKDYFHEEAVLQRYTADMDDLKGLCEKGLAAMENSHRRALAEVERKHKQQLDHLHEEKEKALVQETQATITALEAIRRAHKQELQQELGKLKEDLLKKMQLDQESELVLKFHESELGDIKREILSLSEKYSVKCLENAALEEKLQALSQQLHESSYQVFDLLARNKQLRVYLSADVAQKREFAKSPDKRATVEHLKQLLDLKEYELVEEKEENAQLRNRLHQAQNQIEMLDIHCQQLDLSLQTKRGLWDSEISGLRKKLEAIVAASSMGVEESHSSTSSPTGDKHVEDKFRNSMCVASLRTSELMRSPSCPGLSHLGYLQKAVPLS